MMQLPYTNPEPYIPATLSEIYDMLGAMMLQAPRFVDRTGYFIEQTIDTEFDCLNRSFGVVRKKLGEERYLRVIDLSARAKAAFAADPDESNGKAREGWPLLQEIEAVIQEVRRGRFKERIKDDEGRVTGD